jgi:hypothetical protein
LHVACSVGQGKGEEEEKPRVQRFLAYGDFVVYFKMKTEAGKFLMTV